MNELSYLTLGSDEPDTAVIWLHGLGDSGHGHVDVVQALSMPADWNPRFILPHAPDRPVTINGGMKMPAWYDILAMDMDREVDEAAILESVSQIQALVDEQHAAGIPSSRIFLGGFSQGGAIAFHAGLTGKHPLGGILALSSYLALPSICEEIPETHKAIPVFIGHGRADGVVPFELGVRAEEALTRKGLSVSFKAYPGMEHSICPAEIQDISDWLASIAAGASIA